MRVKDDIKEILGKFENCTRNPSAFLSVQAELEDNVKSQLKSLYDLTKKSEDNSSKGNFTVPRLVTDKFDTEQLWQQIEIQNQFICSELQKRLSLYAEDAELTAQESEFPDSDEQDECDSDDDNDGNEDSVDENSDVEKEHNNDIEDEEMSDLGDLEEDEIDSPNNENEAEEKQKKSVRFNLDDDDDDTKILQKPTIDDNGVKSTFEKRQDRLQKRVEKLEEEALAEKPWQMRGEVTAKSRPQNSLLEEILEFDLTSRPAPIITEEAALKLEDVILRRIKDKAWDDVEKKIKPVDTPFEFKKKLVLDQEKSKLSLAKVYEQEYLKQKEAADPENKFKGEEEPNEHKQIRLLLDSIFRKLDSLSNYHYTPIPVMPELQVVNNLPAVTMEEAIPAAVSDATLLAPEEVQEKRIGELTGKEERTDTDKNRSRRKKKLKQKLKKNTIEARKKYLETVNPSKSNKHGREKMKMELEKLQKNSAVSHFQEDASNSKTAKSSKQFFKRLQDTVSSGTKSKRKEPDVKYDAKKIKL